MKSETTRFNSFEDLGKNFGLNLPEKEQSTSSSFTYTKDKSAKPRTDSGYNKRNNHNNNNNETPPTAPYNFVPLNTVVVKPELANFIKNDDDIQSAYKEFIKTGQKYSGYFDVQIENITPLYIAGENGFFSDGKNICIPGSSLRGCIKNLFKIITNSGVNTKEDPDLTDKHLYYRGMASGYKSMRDAYNDRMVDEVKKNNGKSSATSKAQAGFIVKKDKQYFICPGEYTPKKLEGDWEKAVEFANPEKPYVKWNNKNEADIFTGKMKSSQVELKSKLPKNFSKDRIIPDNRLPNNKVKINTSKVHYYKIYNPQWNILLPISSNIVHDYIDDKNRKGLNLLAEKDNLKKGNATKNEQFDYIIPCFYTSNGKTVEHFGAGPYYRIPYKKSIGNHIPNNIKNPAVDFTNAVFGNKEYWASRVRFEDCFLSDGQTAEFYDENYVKILMGPNPTSFQFYLNADDKNKSALHWDEKTYIRGYKFYWHKKIDWREDNPKMRKDSINKQIKPLKEKHKFSGKIRFKNLDASELGALSYILSLCQDKDICLKLGMGKPVGMGSVKVTAQLRLQNSDYYKTLFNDSKFTDVPLADMQSFNKKFTDYMNKSLANNNSAKINYGRRLDALLQILNIKYMEDTKWNKEKTRYLDINNRNDKKVLNKRIPLPTIAEVMEQIK